MTKVNLDLLASMMIELDKQALRRKRFQAIMQYKFNMPTSMFNTCLNFLKEKRWVEKEDHRTAAYQLTHRGSAFLEGWLRSYR